MRITMQTKVANLLAKKKETRDNDFYVMYWIWKEEFDKSNFTQELNLDFDKTNVVSLLSMLKDKHLSHPSAVMRARRKVQETDPKLRGELWKARHAEEENVKADLGYRKGVSQ